MLIVKLSSSVAPQGQAALRKRYTPIREEWQPDGTWTAMIDVEGDSGEAFDAFIEEFDDSEYDVHHLENEDEIIGHRMAFFHFDSE